MSSNNNPLSPLKVLAGVITIVLGAYFVQTGRFDPERHKNKDKPSVNFDFDEFLKNHYSLINNDEYGSAWDNLSPGYQERKFNDDIQQYKKAYQN